MQSPDKNTKKHKFMKGKKNTFNFSGHFPNKLYEAMDITKRSFEKNTRSPKIN